MKKILIFILFSVFFCLFGYLIHNDKTRTEKKRSIQDQTTDSTSARLPTKKKKNCACCSEITQEIKQTRTDMKWAKDMIVTHGYEDGMKRIIQKSPQLANTMQHIFKEKGSPDPTRP